LPRTLSGSRRRVDRREQIRSEHLLHVFEQTVRSVRGEEVVAGQDDPAEQQASDTGDQLTAQVAVVTIMASRRGEHPIVDPLHTGVRAGVLPPLLPARTRVLLYPLQHGSGARQAPGPGAVLIRADRPHRQRRQEGQNLLDRGVVVRANPVRRVDQVVVPAQRVLTTGRAWSRSRRLNQNMIGHGRRPLNSTCRSSAS
jgi:hypothetical protein